MKPRINLAALVLATGSLVFIPATLRAADNAMDNTKDAVGDAADRTGDAVNNAADKTGDAMNNAADRMNNGVNTDGHAAVAAPDAEDIKEVLQDATEAFVKKGTFDDLVERFVDADRNRIGKDNFVEEDHPDVDTATEAFRAAWKDKYDKDFDIKDTKVVFNQRFQIVQGKIGGAAADAHMNHDNNVANNNMDTNDEANNTGDNQVQDTNREAGRKIATVIVTGKEAGGDLRVPLIKEKPDAWRIDVPDTVDGPRLKDSVVAHLNKLTSMKDQWPSDVNDAYREVGIHMLQAVLDKPVK
jgi:hypothetical protein